MPVKQLGFTNQPLSLHSPLDLANLGLDIAHFTQKMLIIGQKSEHPLRPVFKNKNDHFAQDWSSSRIAQKSVCSLRHKMGFAGRGQRLWRGFGWAGWLIGFAAGVGKQEDGNQAQTSICSARKQCKAQHCLMESGRVRLMASLGSPVLITTPLSQLEAASHLSHHHHIETSHSDSNVQIW